MLLWVDGRSYVNATRTLQELETKVRGELAQSLPREEKAAEGPRVPLGMIAAPAAADVRQKLVVGQRLETRQPRPHGVAGRRYGGLSEPQHRGGL